MSISFACCYGISSATDGIVAGDRFAVYREESTIIGFTGKDGTVFWFVFESCNRVLPLSKAPRYTHADAHELCQAVSDVRIMPEVTFGDVYANRTVCFKVPLKEGVAPTWHTHRAVLVGDSAHKMTPASGMGANQAIESSAVLMNELMKVKRASTSGQPLARGVLYTALKQYCNARKRAGVAMVDETHLLTQSLLCLPGKPTAVAEKMRELTDEQLMHMTIRRWIDAPAMEDLELTARGQFYADVMAVERAKKQALDEPSKPSKMKSDFLGKL